MSKITKTTIIVFLISLLVSFFVYIASFIASFSTNSSSITIMHLLTAILMILAPGLHIIKYLLSNKISISGFIIIIPIFIQWLYCYMIVYVIFKIKNMKKK